MKTSVLPNHFLKCMAPEDRKPLGKSGLTLEEAHAQLAKRAEKEMHADYEGFLRRNGLLYAHVPMNKPSSLPVGHPDFSVYYKNRVLLGDFKVPGGTKKPSQKVWFSQSELNDCPVRIWYSYQEAMNDTTQWMLAIQKGQTP